ncbi:MAG: hypothetical protein KAV87_24650 [Desulfobacteraceae bacterium]|nr:hypothetical protein [Desulfobacteraceae bacterium]
MAILSSDVRPSLIHKGWLHICSGPNRDFIEDQRILIHNLHPSNCYCIRGFAAHITGIDYDHPRLTEWIKASGYSLWQKEPQKTDAPK